MRRRWWIAAAGQAALVTAFLVPAMAPAQAGAPGSVELSDQIVLFDDSVTDAAGAARAKAKHFGGEVTAVFEGEIRGFAGRFQRRDLNALERQPGVAVVAPDGPVSVATTVQEGAPWGLDRIDQVSRSLDRQYRYTLTGRGVTAYVIDTGVRTTHSQFGGRARVGFDALGGNGQDCHGHGTHVAGILGGATYGVAKEVDVVSVRVLGCDGAGRWSDVIAGINFVTNNAAGRPTVANMSLAGGRNDAVDTAVKRSIAAGISYAVAAGNNRRDACRFSPSRVTEAITVGSTDVNDRRASSSNYGSCIDWFAPGVSITSATSSSDTATRVLSGTSMASPHTAGVAALYLEAVPLATPAALRSALKALTLKDVVGSAKSSHDHLLFTNL